MTTDHRYHTADYMIWLDILKPINQVMMRSFRKFAKLDNLFDKNLLGYVFVMGNDEPDCRTFVYGERICKSVSLRHDPRIPQELEQLRGKAIRQVINGDSFFAILTEDGRVFVGSDIDLWKTGQQLRELPERYRQIACGKFHLLLLRKDDDKLMAIGGNGAGEISGDVDSYETLVDTKMDNVKMIACGGVHSMAVTNDGYLYTWGWNQFGQLGLGHKTNEKIPTKVNFDYQTMAKIKDITAGVCHSLVLFEDGLLFGFGSNSFCQLGTEPYSEPKKTPIKIALDNVEAIACSWSYDFSFAFTYNQQCYVWGLLRHIKMSEPTKTKHSIKSFPDATAMYLPRRFEPLTFCLTKFHNKPPFEYCCYMMETIRNWFDNPENFDFEFEVEGRRIYVTKAYLQMTSNYFRKMLSEHWCQENRIMIETYSYDIFYSYLKMLYFGFVSINDDNIEEFLDLATCYLDYGLIEQCQHHIVENVNGTNLEKYCYLASKYDLQDVDDKFLEYFQKTFAERPGHERMEIRHQAQIIIDHVKRNNGNIFKAIVEHCEQERRNEPQSIWWQCFSKTQTTSSCPSTNDNNKTN